MKFLGKIVVVEHLDRYESKLLELPDDAGPKTGVIKAKVINVGNKVGIDIPPLVGMTVLVKQELGTRIEVNGKKLIVYDLEDILAVITQ